jgi:hypothetical protein
MGGTADGKRLSTKQEFAVGTEWTQVRFNYTPAAGLAIRLEPAITVPEGTKLWVDGVRFQPLQKLTK